MIKTQLFYPTFAQLLPSLFFIFKKKMKKMKKVSEAIIYIFCPSFYWYFKKKNENSIFFLKKNGHFS
jgi:hypothetical protein